MSSLDGRLSDKARQRPIPFRLIDWLECLDAHLGQDERYQIAAFAKAGQAPRKHLGSKTLREVQMKQLNSCHSSITTCMGSDRRHAHDERDDWNVTSDNSIKNEFAKYAVVGGLAFMADFSALALLVSGIGLHYLPATFLAFLLGVWVNYLLAVRWVFSYRAIGHQGAEFTIFLVVGVITLLGSLGLMALLVEGAELHYLLAKCLTAAFTLIANFGGRRVLLFTNWHKKMEYGDVLDNPRPCQASQPHTGQNR